MALADHIRQKAANYFQNAQTSAKNAQNEAKTAEVQKDQSYWGKDGLNFKDALDVANPLQHIPLVSSVYRRLTGDELSYGARIIGGTIYGGPVGAIAAVGGAITEQQTGSDVGGNMLAFVAPEPASAETTVALASVEPLPSSSSVASTEVGSAKADTLPMPSTVDTATVPVTEQSLIAPEPMPISASEQAPSKNIPTPLLSDDLSSAPETIAPSTAPNYLAAIPSSAEMPAQAPAPYLPPALPITGDERIPAAPASPLLNPVTFKTAFPAFGEAPKPTSVVNTPSSLPGEETATRSGSFSKSSLAAMHEAYGRPRGVVAIRRNNTEL